MLLTQSSDSDNRVCVDPKTFKEDDLPIIVLCDDLRGFVGWGIKDHTKGNYSHVFIMHKPGLCVSQDFGGFHEKSIEKYLVLTQMLKFWRIKDLTDLDKFSIMGAVKKRLSSPWYHKMYDYLGLVGQFFNIKWIQSPWQEYCSEQVNDDYIQQVDRAKVMRISEPSPSELDFLFKQNPNLMECLGYFWID